MPNTKKYVNIARFKHARAKRSINKSIDHSIGHMAVPGRQGIFDT